MELTEKLNKDIKFEILKKIHSVEDLQKFCKLNKKNLDFCKNNSNIISKYILDKLQVDYTDPTNFIYVANKTNIDSYRENKNWKYKSLFKLYMKYYYKEYINCDYLRITSFPIYPHMKGFYGNSTKLTSFPVQPEMIEFYGDNIIKDLSVQPKMKYYNTDKFYVDEEYVDVLSNKRVKILGFLLNIDDQDTGSMYIITDPPTHDYDFFDNNFDYYNFHDTLLRILKRHGLKSNRIDFESENIIFHVYKEFIDSWEDNIGRISYRNRNQEFFDTVVCFK